MCPQVAKAKKVGEKLVYMNNFSYLCARFSKKDPYTLMILQGKKGLILGALDEQSLAWHVARRCREEGAELVLSNTEQAIRLGTVGQLASEAGLPLVACDATDVEDLRHLLQEAMRLLGGKIDFVLHAVGQSANIRRHRTYDQLNYQYYMQTLDVSAMSLHKLLRTALEEDAISEWGSVVALSYIAAERYMRGYNDMADAKAMLESVVRQMGAVMGEKKHVRVNAVGQSATPTKAGSQFDDMRIFYRMVDELSPLGRADADDCADVCVALFSDLMRRVTMQTIYNDGGYSRTGLTDRMAETYRLSVQNENKQ